MKASNTKNYQDSNNQGAQLSDEFRRLFELLETSIKEDLGIVKAEIRQVESLISDAVVTLNGSFTGMNALVQQQQLLVTRLSDQESVDDRQSLVAQINNETEEIKRKAADAVRSLQFEDIAVQVADNSIQYLDNIETFLEKCKSKLNTMIKADSHNSQVSDLIQSFSSAIQQLRQKRPSPDRKAARQQDLSEGGIELF